MFLRYEAAKNPPIKSKKGFQAKGTRLARPGSTDSASASGRVQRAVRITIEIFKQRKRSLGARKKWRRVAQPE